MSRKYGNPVFLDRTAIGQGSQEDTCVEQEIDPQNDVKYYVERTCSQWHKNSLILKQNHKLGQADENAVNWLRCKD